MEDGAVKQMEHGFVKAIAIITRDLGTYELQGHHNYFSILFLPHHPKLFLLDDR